MNHRHKSCQRKRTAKNAIGWAYAILGNNRTNRDDPTYKGAKAMRNRIEAGDMAGMNADNSRVVRQNPVDVATDDVVRRAKFLVAAWDYLEMAKQRAMPLQEWQHRVNLSQDALVDAVRNLERLEDAQCS